MLEVELYKIVDAGHFWCKPSSRNRTEAESYYTLIGKINDYCDKAEKQSHNDKTKIPKKGKICLVKRTSDRCWYRAKVLSIFQTINGPQTRVLLVDLGERTLVPGIWVQEIPDEFLKVPYQTMECVLSGLKPLTLVTSYFDLTTKKQPGDTWDTSATEWLEKQIHGCTLQIDVKNIDDDGIHHVMLFAVGSETMICFNDELVNNEYAILAKSTYDNTDKTSTSSQDCSKDTFSEELKKMREKVQNSMSLNSDSSPSPSQKEKSKYQPLTWSDESEGSTQGSGNEFGKQQSNIVKGLRSEGPGMHSFANNEDQNKVRFMSARLPATGSKHDQPSGAKALQLKPILKNSSGYSCSEDSIQKDLYHQRTLPQRLNGPNPTPKDADLANNQNSYFSTQNFLRNNDHQGSTSRPLGQKDLPRPARETAMNPNFTHNQNTSFQRQNTSSQNIIQNYDAPSGKQCPENVSNFGSNFTRQNEIHSSTPRYPSNGHTPTVNRQSSNLRNETFPAQYPNSGKITSGHYFASTNSVSLSNEKNINSTFSRQTAQNDLNSPPIQNPYSSASTVKQNGPNAASTFPKPSELHATGSQNIRNESHAPSVGCSRPSETRRNMIGAAFEPQSWLNQSQASFNHSTSSKDERQPMTGNTCGTTPPFSQQRSPTSTACSFPYQPSSFSTSENVSQNTARYPSMSTASTRPQSTLVHHNQQPNMNIFIEQSKDVPVSASQVPQHPLSSVQSTIGPYGPVQENRTPRMSQGRNIPTSAVPHQTVSNSQSQSIIAPQSTVQRQSQYNFGATPGNSNVSVSNVSSTGIPQSRVKQPRFPQTQSQYIPGMTSEYPNVPTYQQSIPQSQSQYSQKSISNIPTNQPQSTGFFGQQQALPPKQFQCNPGNTSEHPNVTNYQSSSSNPPFNQQESFPGRGSEYGPTSCYDQNFQSALTSPRQLQNIPAVTTVYPNEPSNQAKSIKSLQQDFSPNQLSYSSGYPNVPICTFQTTPLPSPIVHNSMVQSLDSLRNKSPSQRLPSGVAPSIPNCESKSPSTGLYPSSASENLQDTSTYQPIEASHNMSQHIQNNQRQSLFNPQHTTQHSTASQTCTPTIPKQPAQTPSTYTSPKKSPRIISLPMPDPKLCKVRDDIIVHGVEFPPPLAEIDSQRFPATILRSLRDLCVIKPTSFQANIWPAILRGRDVFGIPEKSSENVMAYLPPIVTQLAEPGSYSEVPLGNGALALVLCNGWQKATTVYEQCRKLTKNVQNIRTQIIFGAGAEDECIPGLINGCEVLIATIPCLLRMLKKKVTRLDRLCHVIFDDADVLVEEQTENVKQFMREFGALLHSQPDRIAPRQCVVIGNKWSTGVCSLVRVYLGNPWIFIANQIEAAMFCNVRQIVNYVSSDKRESELLSLLDKYTLNNEHEIVIFTSTAKAAERLAQMLEHYSFMVLLAHEFLWPEQLIEVRKKWNTPHSSDSSLILVMTDGVIDKVNIRTATFVIHYEFAATKKMFGKRMFSMASSYPSTKESECLSLTIGTECTTACARSIKELMVRSSRTVPPTLEKVCEFAYKEKEQTKKNDDMCTYLKAFGQCRDSQQCKSRHTVFPDVDVSGLLPKSGIVKVLILAVVDASRYFVRILEHRSDRQEINNHYSGATFLKLALDLNSMYTSPHNRHVCSRIQLQRLCVVESEGSYYRAKIVEVTRHDPETNRALEVQVYFIDRGFYEHIPSFNLFEIAPQFIDIPYQAVEAYVCRIKPLDNDKNWTNKAVRFVKQNIEGKELEGKVIMGLRNTIWLYPLVAKEYLKEINVTTNVFNVRLDLLKEGLALPNKEHVGSLKKHFTSFVQLKHLTGREESESFSASEQIETCSLPEDDYEMVKVSSISNPGLIFLRLDANSNSLEDLVDQINDDFKNQTAEIHEEFSIGSLCLAKFMDDERWYRAKILSIRPEREYDVFFVDYGDREWITQDRIAAMRPEYLQFPFQAIECSLVNISPVGTEWTEDDAEGLWDLVEDKLLFAKVKSKSSAVLAGTCRFGIELCDTSTERDLLVNHELVTAGHAQATLQYLETLFPEAFASNGKGNPKEPFEEIPVLCLKLYRDEDPNTKQRYAQEIKNIVSASTKRKDDIRESGGVRCICQLLGLTKHEAVQQYIVNALARLATQNELNCEEIRREGGLKILCDLLRKARNVELQEDSAWAIRILATSERNRDATREAGGIRNLCDLLASTDQEKVQENICWAVVSLCSDNNNNCDAIRDAGGLETLLKLLESRSNSVLEYVIWAISMLAHNARNKVFIGKEGGIEKICDIIRTSQDEKIIQNAVCSLKTLSSYNDENREIMRRLGIIDLMRRLGDTQGMLPFDTRRTCRDLIQRLLGRAPDVPLVEASSITSPLQEPIKCKPISVTKKRKPAQANGQNVNGDVASDDNLPLLEDFDLPAVHPMTMWSQTKRFVSLSIKLRGVHRNKVNISEKLFYFRTNHLEKLYELNLELFAEVDPKESKVDVRGSEVLVNLKKSQPVTWQRLLSSPEKPPFLSIDFDRWDIDSGSEEENNKNESRASLSTTSAKEKNKVEPRPFDDDQSDSSEFSSEDEREPIGLDFT